MYFLGWILEKLKRGILVHNLPRNLSAIENIVIMLRKGLEDIRRNETRRGEKVGPAGPTLGPVGALFRPRAAAF